MKFIPSITTFISILALNQLQAVVTIYTDETAWKTAATNAGLDFTVENFDTLLGTPSFGNNGALNLASIGLTLSHADPGNGPNDNIVDGAATQAPAVPGETSSPYVRIDDNPNNLSIQVAGTNLQGLAFYYRGYGGTGEGLGSNLGNITPALADPGLNNTAFFGFIDDSQNYTSFSSQGADGAWGIDNLMVARAIPEPSSSLLLGLTAIFGLARRRRSQ